MSVCPKCGKELEEGAKVCDECGTSLYKTVLCPNCRIESSTESDTCPICGTPLPKTFQNEEPQSDTVEQGSEKPELSVSSKVLGIPKKTLLFSCGIGVAIIALVVIIATVAVSFSTPKYALYLKDAELFYTDFSKNGNLQVSEELFTEGEAENYYFYALSSIFSNVTMLSKDGKTIFYIDNLGSVNSSIALYYRSLDKPKKAAVKIDEGVVMYTVNESATLVTYININGLYQYDMKKGNKEKIESDVYRFTVSDNGKKIIYQTNEGGHYLWKAGKGKEKIDDDIESISHITKDLKTVYYIKEDTLYKKTEGKEPAKIASDVWRVENIYDTGEVYFRRTIPYENGNGYDFLLCYYDNRRVHTLTEALDLSYGCASDTPVIAYSANNKWYIAKGAVSTEINVNAPRFFEIDSDGKTIYYFDNIDENSCGDLYKINISKSGISRPELYDTDVYTRNATFLGDGLFKYYKNYESESRNELYINKARLDYDIARITFHEDAQKILYFANGEQYGTLMVYENGKINKIADNVQDYEVLPDGNIIYLHDYDKNSYTGDLYLYKGGNSKKIDSDVIAIIHIVSGDYRGLFDIPTSGMWN